MGDILILLRILDRLEEILIATLMALATTIIFIAVVHRYLLGVPFLFPILFPINLSWAQELCIYMFVWVAKFGAAYGVRTGIHVGVDVVVTNKKFWDGLPPDIRANCEKAMKEATAYGNNQSAKENEDALADIKKTGKSEIIKLTPEQDAAMRKAVEGVYKDVAGRVGQPLIDEFLKETRGATN